MLCPALFIYIRYWKPGKDKGWRGNGKIGVTVTETGYPRRVIGDARRVLRHAAGDLRENRIVLRFNSIDL